MGKVSKNQQQICDLRCQRDENLDPRDPYEDPYSRAYDDLCDMRCVVSERLDSEEFGLNDMVAVDPPKELYTENMFESALITLAYFALGATVMPMVWYALSFHVIYYISLHALFFTIGYQLIMPLSFLMMHRLDGAGVWMKACERKEQSFLLRMGTFVCTIIGIWCLFQWMLFTGFKGLLAQFSFHTFAGIMTIISSVADVVLIFMSFEDESSKEIIGLRFITFLVFLFSSATFISGLSKSSLVNWYPSKHFLVFMIFFCVYYNLVVTFRPIKNFISAMLINTEDYYVVTKPHPDL